MSLEVVTRERYRAIVRKLPKVDCYAVDLPNGGCRMEHVLDNSSIVASATYVKGPLGGRVVPIYRIEDERKGAM